MRIMISYLAGVACGGFLWFSFWVLGARWPHVGGELLALPLILVLWWLGYQMGRDIKTEGAFSAGYRRGCEEDRDAGRLQSWTCMQKEMEL